MIFSRPTSPARVKTPKLLTLQGQKIPFTLIASRLARGVHLRISPQQGLEVVVPARYKLSGLPRLLHEKQNWIFRHLQKMAAAKKSQPQFGDGMALTVIGQPKKIRILQSTRKRRFVNEIGFVHEMGDELFIHCGGQTLSGATPSGITLSAKKTLQAHLKKIAKKYITQRTGEISRQMGTHHGRITIRSQKSRWGSCSRANNLNFNWRLVLMPPETIDYIIIHELAHTIHHNHSRKFYEVVERFCPDYKNIRRALRRTHLPL